MEGPMLPRIGLIHVGGAIVTVPLTHIARHYVSIRWGMAGIYDIPLKKGCLTGAKLWRVADMPALLKLHKEYWDPDRVARNESFEQHMARMPGTKKTSADV